MKIRLPLFRRWLNTERKTSNRGAWAEDLAYRYLHKQGLKLIERNFSCRRGEIDLIMEDQEVLIFIEVRFRQADDYGHPLDTVDWRKQKKLRITAEYFLSQHKRLARRVTRFDVVALQGDQGSPDISWIKAAF
ncbi:MAG: YraN family protein [Pseudomonadota bacterium]